MPGAAFSRDSVAAFRRYFWQPPRAHGEVIAGREVSFLELFNDLVYVVVVGQAAHHFSGDLTWAGAGRFAVVFGLVWLAWIQGAVYHDLHGRAEGRTRTYVFAQMGLLALLAVFTGEAAADDGAPFASVYGLYLLLLGWLWYTVRRQDDPSIRSRTTPYLVGVFGAAAAMGISAVLPASARLAVWVLVVLGWLVAIAVLDWRNGATRDTTVNASASMIERFDLFTIIVLGEVVVGVVNGIADAGRTPSSVATGILGLGIGFAYWWSYFDLVGGRRLRPGRGTVARWLIGHLPVTLTIAGSGAVMVGMVEHAEAAHAPRPAAMLLATSVAVGLLALVVIASALVDWRDLGVGSHVSAALLTAAGVALVLGWLDPAPWVQIVATTAVLGVAWLYLVLTWFAVAKR